MTVDAAAPAPRARGDVVSARIGTHLLLFEPATRRLHTLNAGAALVWERLDGTATVQTIARRLGERYAADRAVVEADVVAVIGRFAALGLLAGPGNGEETAAVPASPAPPVASAPPIAPAVAAAAAVRLLEEHSWAWTSGPLVALGHRFQVCTEDAASGGALARVLRSLRTADVTTITGSVAAADADHVYSVLDFGARWSVYADGVPLGVADSVDAVVSLVLWQIDRAAVAGASQALCFHGGAVRIGRQVVLLPGARGSGTSALTGALVRRGAGYVADQVAAFDPVAGGLLAYPRPIGTTPPVAPASIPGAALAPGGPVGLVVSPVHAPGVPTRVARRTGPDAVRLLLDTTGAFDTLGAGGFLALVTLAKEVPVYQVRFGDLDVGCEVVLELARAAG